MDVKCINDISRLGFGTLRLPEDSDNNIDVEKTRQLIDYALKSGIRIIDLGKVYHKGKAEAVVGSILKDYPRESYEICSKFPGHVKRDNYDVDAIFKEQLSDCNVEYFDYYMLHNVIEASLETYMDEEIGIVNYLIEQKKQGRIRQLGFSCHAELEAMIEFVEKYDGVFDICIIQLNYLDWTLQRGKEKYEYLTEKGIDIWVMEPLRGGALCHLPEHIEKELKSLRSDEPISAWSFRFLLDLPNIKCILSGMAEVAQIEENARVFGKRKPLDKIEYSALMNLVDSLEQVIPCTKCRYCIDSCSAYLDIPALIQGYNDVRFATNISLAIACGTMPDKADPAKCTGCGKCIDACPQKIDIPGIMKDFTNQLMRIPDWMLRK